MSDQRAIATTKELREVLRGRGANLDESRDG